jgi:choice-of-anchor C domain-containing protein
VKIQTLRTAAASALAVMAIAAAQPASAVELLTNGGFNDRGAGIPESWGGLTYYAGGPVLLPGWTVESGSVDLTDTNSIWGPAAEGQYSLDINGWSQGTIAQSFATVLGKLYTVSFAYSRNPANAPNLALATVSAGGETFNVTAQNGQFGGMGSMDWATGSFSFVGTGQTETLRLASSIPGNAGVFFDQVSVTGGVPEPATWAVMITGFGLAGAALRRRRAAPVAT